MSKLVWDKVGERYYETGVDHGVIYQQNSGGTYPKGVAWSGLTAVTEAPSGAEPTPLYADNIKYLNLLSNEAFYSASPIALVSVMMSKVMTTDTSFISYTAV